MLSVEDAKMEVVGTPRVDGQMEMVLEVSSDDRDTLVEHGRQFVISWLRDSDKYNSWATAGIDKASGPICYDPLNPEADPYELAKKAGAEGLKWRYRQLFKLTRMI